MHRPKLFWPSRIWSRHQRLLTRSFPEMVTGLRRVLHDVVLDGQIVIRDEDRLDFEALLLRLHPAQSRIELLSRKTPASLVVFDLLHVDGTDIVTERFEAKAAHLGERARGLPHR